MVDDTSKLKMHFNQPVMSSAVPFFSVSANVVHLLPGGTTDAQSTEKLLM